MLLFKSLNTLVLAVKKTLYCCIIKETFHFPHKKPRIKRCLLYFRMRILLAFLIKNFFIKYTLISLAKSCTLDNLALHISLRNGYPLQVPSFNQQFIYTLASIEYPLSIDTELTNPAPKDWYTSHLGALPLFAKK